MRLAATLGAPHQQIYDQRGSPQSSCVTPGEAPTYYVPLCMYVCRVPTRNPLQNQCLPTSRIMFVCVYDQAGFPQGEFRPGRLPTTKITTREPTHKQNHDQGAGWLAGWLAELRPGNLSCTGWLAGWLGGWQAGCLRPKEPQGGPEKPTEAERG